MFNKHAVLGGRDRVKVAIAQIAPRYLDKVASIEVAIAAIKEASLNKADLVVFPEVWLSGYPYWTEGWDSKLPEWIGGRVRFYDSALVIPGKEVAQLAEVAKASDIHLVMGCNELDSRANIQTVYNTLLYIGRNGQILGRHRKLMPTFSERLYWGSGDGNDLEIYETDIGRIGGLICGEHLITSARSALIAMGEHIHIAVFPGSFALHTGPQLEEPDHGEAFWGYSTARSHAMEAGAFVIQACGYIESKDIPSDFQYKNQMNFSYALGGSSVISPLGVPIVEPQFNSGIIYADLDANMIKAVKAIVDSNGHYSRHDVFKLLMRKNGEWRDVQDLVAEDGLNLDYEKLSRSAESLGVDVTGFIEKTAD